MQTNRLFVIIWVAQIMLGCRAPGRMVLVDEDFNLLPRTNIWGFSIERDFLFYRLDTEFQTDDRGCVEYSYPARKHWSTGDYVYFWSICECDGKCLVSVRIDKEYAQVQLLMKQPTMEDLGSAGIVDFIMMKPIEKLSRSEIVELLCSLGAVGAKDEVRKFWDMYDRYVGLLPY